MKPILNIGIIISQTELKNIYLCDMEEDEDKTNSFNFIYNKTKEFTNNPYKKRYIFWEDISGRLLRFDVKLPRRNKIWKIVVYNITGSIRLGLLRQKKINYVSDKLSDKNYRRFEFIMKRYRKGYVKCSHCGTWVKESKLAGNKYDNIYCEACWNLIIKKTNDHEKNKEINNKKRNAIKRTRRK